MTVTLDQELVGVLFLDNLTDPNAFDASDLDKLKRYREHAVSAIAKARQKENIELLSRIGKDITASLSIKNIVDTVYENVNALMDASVFDIGIYNPENNQIDFPGTKEKGETMPPSSDDLDDVNRLSAWCFKQQKEILIHDYKKDYKEYIEVLPDPRVGELPESIIYVPMAHKGEAIGVITAQSFRKNAYTEYHVNILRNLAAYTAIAMDNASAYKRLDATLQNLQSTQEKLVTQEKLASLGALTAGIAHEIKNPLNFVNNFAELSAELVDELHEELLKNKDNKKAAVAADIEDILNDLKQNAQKINEHGKRADSIVRSMLQHSRGKPGEKQEMDLNAMLEEDLNLAYHGMRAQNSEFNAEMLKELDQSLGTVKVVPQDISRVFLNIMTNGFYEAFSRKSRENGDFSPSLLVGTRKMGRRVEVRIRDNGSGIPEAIQDKLFNPFFTTKPAGQGTGLGLSISHDIIVQGHNGDIKFETQAGEFTEFIITLPIA